MSRLLAHRPVEPAQIGTWLRQLAEQVEALAPVEIQTPAHVPADLLRQALRDRLKARRARDALFGADLFADPAWDLLLDLLLCDLEQRRVSISSACLAAAVPATTALRWIVQLETRGLVLRIDDPGDRRRSYLTLTPAARDALLLWARRYLPIDATAALGPTPYLPGHRSNGG